MKFVLADRLDDALAVSMPDEFHQRRHPIGSDDFRETSDRLERVAAAS